MLQLQVDNMITLDPAEIPGFLLRRIECDLTLLNPQNVQAERLGYWTGNLDREIRLFRYKDGRIILPRGYGPELVKLLQKHDSPFDLDDRRLVLPAVEFNSRI